MYLHGNILTVVWVQIPSEESSNLQADEPLRYWSTLRYWKGAVWSRWPEPEDVWFSKLYSSLEFFGASSLLLSHKYNHFPHLLMLSLKCLSFFKKKYFFGFVGSSLQHVGSSSLTRNEPRPLASGIWSLSHWTTRGVLEMSLNSVSFFVSIMPWSIGTFPCSVQLFSASALPSLDPGAIFSRGCLNGTYCLTQNSLMRQLGINTEGKNKRKDSNPFLHHTHNSLILYRMKSRMYVEKE